MRNCACLIAALAALSAVGAEGTGSAAFRPRIAGYLASLETPGGLYGWEGDDEPHLAVTHAVLRSYAILGLDIPGGHAGMAKRIARMYPFDGARPEEARTRWHAARLFEYDTMAAECVRMLSGDMEAWRVRAECSNEWQEIDTYITQYEEGCNPVFVQQMHKLKLRDVAGAALSGAARENFVRYLAARERADGTFNTTPACDGSGGHVVNTYWGLYGKRFIGSPLNPAAAGWIERCRLPDGGFTWTPDGKMPGRVADVVYARAAVAALALFGRRPSGEEKLVEWLLSLRNADGGFGDRPGARSNAPATCAALETLAALGRLDALARAWPAAAPPDPDLGDPELKAFTIQFQAPGSGSVREAVEVARLERIHLWGAKNASPGWIEAAQREAQARKVPVTFFPSDEKYGVRRSVPGLGNFTHCVDPAAPPPVARDRRPFRLWQICDHECFARVMLDSGEYDAVGTFHFGCHDMTWLLPFVRRYENDLVLVSNQDSHGETWWWQGMLHAFRTVFLAREASWDAFREACAKHRVASVREDAHTAGRLRLVGCSPAVRRAFMDRADQWRRDPGACAPPRVSIQLLGGDDVFEVAHPASGRVVRVRTARRWIEGRGLQESACRLVRATLGGVELPIERKEFRRADALDRNGILEDAYDLVAIPDGAEGKVVFRFAPEDPGPGPGAFDCCMDLPSAPDRRAAR